MFFSPGVCMWVRKEETMIQAYNIKRESEAMDHQKKKKVSITYIGGEQQKKVRKGALSEPKS